MSETTFLTKASFTRMVEEYVLEKNATYLESMVDLCEKLDIDPSDVSKYVSPIIKNKLKVEAAGVNLVHSDDSTGSVNLEDVL